jgi:hypothetical protein
MVTRASRTAIFLLASSAAALAQDPAPSPAPATTDASSVILARKQPEAVPAPVPASQAGSPGESTAVGADISSGLPSYDAGFRPARANSGPLDARETDKPANQIPRLPTAVMSRYVVHGARPVTFRNVDLFNRAGLIDLSFKARPGLRVGNFLNLNAKLAYQAALDDQKLSDREDLVDTAIAMAAGGDPSEAAAVQESIIDQSFSAETQAGPVATGPAPR